MEHISERLIKAHINDYAHDYRHMAMSYEDLKKMLQNFVEDIKKDLTTN